MNPVGSESFKLDTETIKESKETPYGVVSYINNRPWSEPSLNILSILTDIGTPEGAGTPSVINKTIHSVGTRLIAGTIVNIIYIHLPASLSIDLKLYKLPETGNMARGGTLIDNKCIYKNIYINIYIYIYLYILNPYIYIYTYIYIYIYIYILNIYIYT